MSRVSDYVTSRGIKNAVVSLSLCGSRSQAMNDAVEALVAVSAYLPGWLLPTNEALKEITGHCWMGSLDLQSGCFKSWIVHG
jgi:hypothetical protein